MSTPGTMSLTGDAVAERFRRRNGGVVHSGLRGAIECARIPTSYPPRDKYNASLQAAAVSCRRWAAGQRRSPVPHKPGSVRVSLFVETI